jgi:hypothetical protein
MLTHIETERQSREAGREVSNIVVGYPGSNDSDKPVAVAAERAGLHVSVVTVHAAASGPDWLGAP